jgi:DNA-cytosine methyltransferase
MNVLSLFNGMSFCSMALESLGVNADKMYSSEIDKYANQATQAMFPDTIQLGDVTQWREWGIDWASIDLVTGGFPCQAWSMAGKQLGDKDERGMLFWTMLDIIKHAKEQNPNIQFLIENVKMKKEFEQYITTHTENALGKVYKILINSALVSAQNRNRYYWTSSVIEQPEDKRIFLIDVLEKDLPTCGLGARIVGRKINEYGKRDDYNKDIKIEQYMEVRFDGKSNCMTTVYKDAVVPLLESESRIKIRFKSKTVRAGGRGSAFGDKHEWDCPLVKCTKKLKPKANHNKSSCLTGGANSGGNHSDMDMLIIEPDVCRRYSVREAFRLQTVPEHHIDTLLNSGISNTQLYKMCGNGWTMEVIKHIFKAIL